MVPILERVITEGTGRNVRIPGHRVAGKTGTAQILGKSGELLGYVASFIGFAPADDPRFLVLVMLENPRRDRGVPYGGTCAGPAVRQILERCLSYAEVPPALAPGVGYRYR
jgi:cell division protein FtsI/penicillin-binding protein 2